VGQIKKNMTMTEAVKKNNPEIMIMMTMPEKEKVEQSKSGEGISTKQVGITYQRKKKI
jgi:hypothetical protein